MWSAGAVYTPLGTEADLRKLSPDGFISPCRARAISAPVC